MILKNDINQLLRQFISNQFLIEILITANESGLAMCDARSMAQVRCYKNVCFFGQ